MKKADNLTKNETGRILHGYKTKRERGKTEPRI